MKLDRQTKIWLVAAIVVVMTPVIINVMTWIIPQMTNRSQRVEPSPTTEIANWEDIAPNVPSDTRRRVEERLYSQIAVNLAGEVPGTGASLRADSTYTMSVDDGGFTIGDFIVDVPSIEQSYIIQYFYGQLAGEQETEISASVRIYCVTDPAEQIYADFGCKDVYGAYDSEKFIDSFYLEYVFPHVEMLENGSEMTVNLEYGSDGDPMLVILVENCGDNRIIEKAKKAVAAWVEELGFDADHFEYYVPLIYNNCKV